MTALLFAPTLSLLLTGCTGGQTDVPSTLSAINADTPVRVEVAGGAGTGTVEVPVLLVNEYGAAIAGTQVEVGVDEPGFTLAQSTLDFDAEGHALARVQASHTGAFTLRVLSSADGAETGATGTGVALGAPAPTVALDSVLPRPVELGEAQAMARGTGGVALVGSDSVWWVPAAPGQVPWQVLAPPFTIVGVRTADVDADGVADLALWGDQDVVLLRGRAGGGYSWGAGWQSPDMTVAGVSVADVDGDQLSDVVIGQTDADAARVEMLLGDGVWGFSAVSPLQLSVPITDLVAADEDSDGRPDITVIDGHSGYLDRYSWTADGWTGSSPPQLDRYSFPAGSVLLPPADLNGDGVLDVIGVSGPASGAQSLVFYVLIENNKYEQSYASIHATVRDVDLDGAADLLLMDDGILHRIRWDSEVGGFVVGNYSSLAQAGPIASGDFNGDTVADLAVLEDGVVLHQGAIDEVGAWSVGSTPIQQFIEGLTGPFELADLDGDGDRDVVGIVTQGGSPAVRVWLASWTADGGMQYSSQGTLTLNATGEVHALAHCSPDWYFLADNSAAGLDQPDKAFRVRIESSNGFVPTNEAGDRVTGSMLACGYPDTGDNRRFTVADTDGHYTVYAYNFAEVDQGERGPTQAIAYADTDGNGIDELQSCSETGCSLFGVDLDRDGVDEVVQGGSTITVDGWGSALTVPATGTVSVDDADGDGRLDILVADSTRGRITAIPTLTNTLGPAVAWFTAETITGGVRTTDYDGDGRMELVFRKGSNLVGTTRSKPAAGE